MTQCSKCGKENKDAAKFCTGCGTRLGRSCPLCGAAVPPEAKFCTECGASLAGAASASEQTPKPDELASIPLAPLALGLPECKIDILEVSAEGHDDDGDIRVEVKYEITNDTDEDWEYLDVRVQLLSAAGQVVEETRDTQEQTISAGDTAEFEAGFWGVQASLLGPNLDKAHILISVTACGLRQQKLDGPSSISAASFEPAAIKPATVGDVLQVVSGSLWKTDPDDDQDCRVEVRVLVQNLTANHLPLVKLQVEITDKAGREVADAGGSDEVRPGSIGVLNGSGYGKDEKLAGAKTELALLVHYPLAAGNAQAQGMELTKPEEDDYTDNGDAVAHLHQVSSAMIDHLVGMKEIKNMPLHTSSTQSFYASMDWFDVAEQPDGFDDLPDEFQQAHALWEADPEGNQADIVEMLAPFVKAWFIPANISNWDALFVDSDEEGFFEIPAREVNVAGIDFSHFPIPTCKAEAKFKVPVTHDFASIDLDAWQDENDRFTSAVSFYWDIPRTDDTEQLDFTHGDNQGVECLVVTNEN